MKTAFIFPGQGAQYIGMAKDFYEQIPVCREIIERGQSVLDFDLKSVLFEENELINKTEYTQACLLAAEICIFEGVKQHCSPSLAAGLSLGEYAALVASGVMTFEDALRVVRLRGKLMEYAVPAGEGGMAAVISLDCETVEKICKEVSGETGKTVVVANYNCPGQIVISGHRDCVEIAAERMKTAGAKLVSMLNVSGPFHSPLLLGAGESLGKVLCGINTAVPVIPYVTNVDASVVTQPDRVKDLLVSQVSSPVLWEKCIATLRSEGVEQFIEIGPGKTLAGFMKRIDREIVVKSISTVEDLAKLADVVGGKDVGAKITAA